MPQYRRPGLILRKERNRQMVATIGVTQRFPCFVGIGRPTISIYEEPVVRGFDDNPDNPASAPKNGMDSLTRDVTETILVESSPGLKDFILEIDYTVADGKIDWGLQTSKNIIRESSRPIDSTYQVVINRPNAGTLSKLVNFSAFQSAESLLIGSNANASIADNTITIQLEHSSLSNSTGDGFGSEGNNSLVFTNDTTNKFRSGSRIAFSAPFTSDKQWKFDPSSGTIISYDTTDLSLPAGLSVDYMYVAEYDTNGSSVSPDGTSFVLDADNNVTLPTFLSGDWLEVDYSSVQDGREPEPGQTYYVSYVGFKTDLELNPAFYGGNERLEFQSDYGNAGEFLDGNQLALVGELQFAMGTQGFHVSPVRSDNQFEWGSALQRTSQLPYDDLVPLTSSADVKQLARKLALDRSAPERKLRTILWSATSPNQPSGFTPGDPEGNTMKDELEILRHERVIYTGTQRKNQMLLTDIPLPDGTVETDVEVPVYWANVSIVNVVESFSSASTSALRQALLFFRTNPEASEYTPLEADAMAGAGVMVLEDNLGSARIRDDVTTMSSFDTPDEAELSVRTAEDALIGKIIEPTMDRQLIGTKITDRGLIVSQATNLLNDLLTEAENINLIGSGEATKVEFNPKDPRELMFEFEWSPVFTLKKLTGLYSVTLPR